MSRSGAPSSRWSLSAYLLGTALGAQSPATLTSPAVHPIGPVTASSPLMFARVSDVRPLADGRVLVNDATARTLTMLDPTLKTGVVVLDSSGGKGNSYGARPGKLNPFTGDSSLFYDPASLAVLVLDPAGKVARVTASVVGPPPPPGTRASALNDRVVASQNQSLGSNAAYSSAFGWVYHGAGGIDLARFGSRIVGDSSNVLRLDDSVALYTMNPTSRAVDTVGHS